MVIFIPYECASFKHHVRETAKRELGCELEKLSFILGKPDYQFERTQWRTVTHILRSKIEKGFFGEWVYIGKAIGGEGRQISKEEFLMKSNWKQVIKFQNFGTIACSQTDIGGTVFIHAKEIVTLYGRQKEVIYSNPHIDELVHEVCPFLDSNNLQLKESPLRDETIETIKNKFPYCTSTLIRELISHARRGCKQN
jgi:hypothetical protein